MKRENLWSATSCMPHSGDWACNPESNWWPPGSWVDAQPPSHPGWAPFIFLMFHMYFTLWPSQVIVFLDTYTATFSMLLGISPYQCLTGLCLPKEPTFSTSLSQNCLYSTSHWNHSSPILLSFCILVGNQFCSLSRSTHCGCLSQWTVNLGVWQSYFIHLCFLCSLLHNSGIEQVPIKVCWNFIKFTNCVKSFL